MKIKEKIRQKASTTLDVLIPEGKWGQYADMLDRENKFTKINLIKLILHLCQSVEKLEYLMEDIYFEVELMYKNKEEAEKLKNDKGAEKQIETSFKLKTANEIMKDMDDKYTTDTHAFYLNQYDWDLYAKANVEDGYSLMIDPKDMKEKRCVMYKDLPVFRA